MERGNSTSLCSRRGKHCAGSVRRICDLPDSVLSHILSFLPTKNAVATSILSQRWKFLWTMTINLYFGCYRYDVVDRFVEFANYVLRLHNPGILNEFTLSWGTRCVPFYVNAWITTAISRNVRKLILYYVEISEFPISVQRSIFSCESLQSLDLNVNYAYCISQEISFSLPNLESLELESVIFESEETLCKLLGGCPVLEDLYLRIKMAETKERCHLDDGIAFRCIISSTSLRRLVLFADGDRMSICGVQLRAPSLEYIELQKVSSISVQQTPISLVEADIQLAQPHFEEHDHYNSVVDAICDFDCAKKLVLNWVVIEAFKRVTIEMKTVFNQLTKLEVTKGFVYWIDLHRFLQWVGNLEVFIVHQDGVYHVWGTDSDEEEHKNRIAAIPNLVPRCLSDSLKFFLIDRYAVSDDEGEDDFRMISYILKHASVLQLMEIPTLYLKNEREVIQKISELPRKSPVCEVEFPRYGPNKIFKS